MKKEINPHILLNKQSKILVVFFFFFYSVLFVACNKENITDPKHPSTVSEDLAKIVACNFAYDRSVMKEGDYSKSDFRTKSFISDYKVKNIKTEYINDNIPALYIIELDPEGFVIVAGTKKEIPVLAYSEKGSFIYDTTDIGFAGVSEWLNSRKLRIIELLSDKNVNEIDSISEIWDGMAPPEDEEEIVSGGTIVEQIGPLLSTTWGQGCGYNDLINVTCTENIIFNCGHPFTGCVATATAQVMRYWQYPSSYNWTIMPMIITQPNQSNETARLIHEVGTNLNTIYGCNGSFAITEDIINVLKNIYGYKGYMLYLDFNYSIAANQIALRMPIIVRGSNLDAEGHAWVCDGTQRLRFITIHNPGTYYEYETSTYSPYYFWMNWGWNGTNNAWFLNGEFSGFNINNKMIINIKP
jgi:streptopain